MPEGPGAASTIGIDVDLYLPDSPDPAPAVLLAHGFGASKDALAADAERLRADGYVVLAYSARGFGDSGGRISLDAIDYEVADARALVDTLAERPEVEQRSGDPVVGVAGASYGGALALMLGATDPRIDAVAAAITWNDLADSLVPQAGEADVPAPGVFKEAWATQLFGAAASGRDGPCGRLSAELCTLYTKLVGGGQLDAVDRALLAASSPALVLDGMTAPTLLLQGRQDTLFGLDQADASARQIVAAGARVKVSWFAGGHDGTGLTAGALDGTGSDAGPTGGTENDVDEWFAEHLRGAKDSTGSGNSGGSGDSGAHAGAAADPFEYTVPASARGFAETRVAPGYPGLDGTAGEGDSTGKDGAAGGKELGTHNLPLSGDRQIVVNPPGGLPAAITSLPGTGPLDAAIAGLGSATPGGTASQPAQQARFDTAALEAPFVLAGSPTATVDLALAPAADTEPGASAPPLDVVLFAQLRVTSGDSDIAVGGGVAPVRVTLAADGSATRVRITLPATTWRFESGDVIGLSLRTTDAGYQASAAAAAFTVDASGDLALPTVEASDPAEVAGTASPIALVGIPLVLLIGLVLALVALRRNRLAMGAAQVALPVTAPTAPPTAFPAVAAAPPLVIRGLTKDYRAGFRAVDDLSFTVQRGRVLGLLGPNGAGKTTALRMITGLLRPDAGEIEIFGERVVPGSRVLTRVGCFIEGPGFLSHLSGRRNLELYWAASGRPRLEARFDEALEIADLGAAVERRVGGYSQGMRQRLAIAQAMLGMPELLILDEPANGLDPPQIFALRGVLRRYAETGRTVIVSSHLLGEVEQTCSDVVVMARGRLLAAGPVAELAGDTNELTIEVTDVEGALRAVGSLPGAAAVTLSPRSIRVLPGDNPPESVAAAIIAAEVGIRSMTRGRHLEETFLAMVESEGVR